MRWRHHESIHAGLRIWEIWTPELLWPAHVEAARNRRSVSSEDRRPASRRSAGPEVRSQEKGQEESRGIQRSHKGRSKVQSGTIIGRSGELRASAAKQRRSAGCYSEVTSARCRA